MRTLLALALILLVSASAEARGRRSNYSWGWDSNGNAWYSLEDQHGGYVYSENFYGPQPDPYFLQFNRDRDMTWYNDTDGNFGQFSGDPTFAPVIPRRPVYNKPTYRKPVYRKPVYRKGGTW
ncbi:MAG: hypothetical protein K2P78_07995 [Gemmataceae bacterium]|nr:hypothetical protein [Gemmataceae bacterium]